MARNITISTLARDRSITMDNNKSMDEAVNIMINYWDNELKKVIYDKPDIIILPEGCDRFDNFDTEKLKEYYNVRGDQIRDFFAEKAKKYNTYISYTAIRGKDDNTYRNSTEIIDRNGDTAGIYNKNHLFISEKDDMGMLYGKDAPIIECDFGRVACAICFDLNFTELLNKYIEKSPDLIIFSSVYHGGLMQKIWAYLSRAYFVGCICGEETRILNPLGEIVAESSNFYNYVSAKVNLDYMVCHLDHHRGKFAEIRDKYGSDIDIFVPKNLAATLLTCKREDMTINDIKNEYDMKTIDEYFEFSLNHRHTPEHIEK